MVVGTHLPGYRWLEFFGNVAVRMGVYVGVCLSLLLSVGIVVANRVAFLERFALERNLVIAAGLGLFAALPVLRFIRMPGRLLISSLIAWSIFSFTYRLLCLFFTLLNTKYTAFQVFMLGAVVYLIVTTLSWICTLIWRVRASHAPAVPQPRNHVS